MRHKGFGGVSRALNGLPGTGDLSLNRPLKVVAIHGRRDFGLDRQCQKPIDVRTQVARRAQMYRTGSA